MVTDHFQDAVRTLGIDEKITLHTLRHYSASIMHYLNASDEDIRKRGGWSNSETINKYYKGNIKEFEDKATRDLNEFYEKTFLNS